MRILLVNPPRSPENAIYESAPKEAKHFVHKKLIGPPLGLLTIAEAVKDHEVTLLEMKGEYDLVPNALAPEALLLKYLNKVNPDIVGVTFIASEFPAGLALLRTVKQYDPHILTVAGGLHAILCPEDFEDPAVDVLYCNQSAHAFRDLVQAHGSGQSFEQIGGLQIRTGKTLSPTKAAVPERDIAGTDFIPPDRSLLKRWLSTYRVGQASGLSTYLYTSLGCQFRCSFCSIWPQFKGVYYQRHIDSVVEELKTLDDYEVVRFADANTVIDSKFAKQLFDKIEAEGINKTYVMDIRADTAANSPHLIEKMARAGLKVVITGFESFREEELRNYNKKLKVDLINEAMHVFHENDIMVRGNYVVPPDYAENDFAALSEFAAGHKVALAGYTILTPMPGTNFHREVQAQIVDRDLAKYNFFNCVMKTKLPLEKFYEYVGELWKIRLGSQVI
ncbi:MAG: radical SAM protein [Pseudomonadota bacterium]